MCYINILSKLLDFSRRSAVQFGLKKTLKIPVFTGILMAVYRLLGICDIDPLYRRVLQALNELQFIMCNMFVTQCLKCLLYVFSD